MTHYKGRWVWIMPLHFPSIAAVWCWWCLSWPSSSCPVMRNGTAPFFMEVVNTLTLSGSNSLCAWMQERCRYGVLIIVLIIREKIWSGRLEHKTRGFFLFFWGQWGAAWINSLFWWDWSPWHHLSTMPAESPKNTLESLNDAWADGDEKNGDNVVCVGRSASVWFKMFGWPCLTPWPVV